jgi:hypothetical protein
VLFVFLDFLVPGIVSRFEPAGPAPILFGLVMGFVVGQWGLAVLWGVFGSPPLAARWLILLAVIELGTLAGLLGGAMAEGTGPGFHEFVRVAGMVLLTMPLVFLVLQIPLGFLRAITGWQIAPWGVVSPAAARQFRLADLFTVTAIAAVSLGLTQAGMSLVESSLGPPPALYLLTVMGSSGLLSVLNAVLSLPCLWAVFGARAKGAAVAVLLSCYFVVALLLVMIFSIMAPGPSPELLGFWVAFELAYGVVVWGGLRLLREAQYELVRPRTRRPGAAQLSPAAEAGDSPFARAAAEAGDSPFAPPAPSP